MSVSLKAGGNYVVYTGKAQSASNAFASIMSYLDPAKVVYYWNNITALYEQVITTTVMVPYGCYWIEVTQNCTWTYGAEATAPTSVQLYGTLPDWTYVANIIAYCGPSQPAENAFSSISSYLLNTYYFDNTQKIWRPLTSSTMMVPFGVYVVWVSRNCVWTFAAVVPHLGTDIVGISAPSSAPAGETVIVDVSVKNIGNTDQKIAVTGVYDSTSLSWQFDYLLVSPGQTVVMRGWFTMPSKKVRVTVYSKYWSVQWVQDDSGYVDIALAELVPTFSEFGMAIFNKV